MESILEGFAEYYSAELSQTLQRGHHDNALKAKNNGGYTPLGYVVDPAEHALAVDPITAPLAREIYDRYDKGDRITDICESFRQRGIKTKRGTDDIADAMVSALQMIYASYMKGTDVISYLHRKYIIRLSRIS